MKSTVVVLGPCGAGKSSMLNRYLDRHAFPTSNKIEEDGTKAMVVIDRIVDTPGLDTVNATSISAVRLREMLEPNFSVVLVVPKTITRITMWKTKFDELLRELCHPGGTILVVWTFPGALKPDDSLAIERLCAGRVCTHVDSEAQDFRALLAAHFTVPSCSLRQSIPSVVTPMPAVVLKPAKKTNPVKKAAPAALVHRDPRLPAFNHILPRGCLGTPLPVKEADIHSVFAAVKAMKSGDVDKYSHMKMIGDALLDFLTLMALHRDGEDLTEGKEKICGNGDAQPMAKLYDRWKLKLDEGEDLNGHSKADVVEAMLAHCLYSGSGAIIAPLFRAIYEAK